MLGRLVRKVRYRWWQPSSAEKPEAYWELRARVFGARAVLNLGHSDSEFDAFTEWQWRTLRPFFERALAELGRVPERVLDFGCGPGRFTPRIAAMAGCEMVGVDISETLLKLAPKADNCRYQLIKPNEPLPFLSGSFDIMSVVLVLGGIVADDAVRFIANEITRCLRPGGIIILVENTAHGESAPHWQLRPVEAYQHMFAALSLSLNGEYKDLDDRISVLTGRKG